MGKTTAVAEVKTNEIIVLSYPTAEVMMSRLEKSAKELVKLGDEAIDKAGIIVIRAEADVANAIDFIAKVKNYTDRVESGRKELGDPLRKVVDQINNQLMPVTKRLKEAEDIVKSKIRTYNLEQQRRAEEEAEHQRKAQDEARKKFEEEQRKKQMMAEAQGKKVEPVKEFVPEPIAVQTQVQTTVTSKSGASSGMTDHWIFEVLNPDEVDRKYCTPNEKLIKAAIATGTRNIRGLRIYNEPIVNVRRG